jgi:hypothetical protein
MSQTTFLIVAGVSLALLAASGNIDGFQRRPRMPGSVLSQAELQLFTTTRATGEIVMAGSSGVIIDQGFQAVRVGTDAITFLAGSTADTEVVRIGTNGNVGIGTTNSSTNRLTVQGAARLNGTSAALELNDGNSGLTYSSSTNAFVGTGTSAKPSNGPVLFGQTDGALGVKGGGQANALYWNSTGVGIKNNAPAYELDVTGGVHATSNAIFDSKVGIGNSAPGANYALDVTGGVHATSNAIFDSKVGIGNSAPGANYALDVTGGVHATSNAIFDSKVGIGTSAPGASYALDVTGGVHATSNAIFDANVGIGNSSPAYKLDVTGGVHATSNAIFDSKVGIGTSAPGASYALDVTGGVHATSNAIFDSKVGIGNAAPGADYALDVTGNVNFTGSLYQGGSLFKTSQWTTTGSDIIYTAGKIGIGVTAPTAAIHVAAGSDINLSNALVVKNSSTTTLAANTSLGLTFASLNGSGGGSAGVTNGYTSNQGSYVLFTIQTTDGPSTTWASTGAVPFAANSVFSVNITLSSTDSYPPGVTITTNDAAGDIGYDNTADFWSSGGRERRRRPTRRRSRWRTRRTGSASGPGAGSAGPCGSTPFSVTAQAATNASAVNVGVGTTNPNSPLTVVGTAASAAASSLTLAKEWKAQHVIYAQGSAYALKLGAHYTAGVGAYSSIQSTEFYSGTEYPGHLSLNPLGGNVGIGTISPVGKFHVYDATCSTQIYTNPPTSHPSFPNNGIVLEANPNAGYSSVLIRSYHTNVSDRYLLWVQCSQSPNYFYVRNDGYTYASWFAAGSKAFDIQHPLHADPAKRLVHLSIEGPRSDLLYRRERPAGQRAGGCRP